MRVIRVVGVINSTPTYYSPFNGHRKKRVDQVWTSSMLNSKKEGICVKAICFIVSTKAAIVSTLDSLSFLALVTFHVPR